MMKVEDLSWRGFPTCVGDTIVSSDGLVVGDQMVDKILMSAAMPAPDSVATCDA